MTYVFVKVRLVLNGQNIGTSETEEYLTNKYRRVSDPGRFVDVEVYSKLKEDYPANEP